MSNQLFGVKVSGDIIYKNEHPGSLINKYIVIYFSVYDMYTVMTKLGPNLFTNITLKIKINYFQTPASDIL